MASRTAQPPAAVSSRVARLAQISANLLWFATESAYARRDQIDDVCDFALGNPHDMPLPDFATALTRQVEPRAVDWYAYKNSETAATETVVAALRSRHGSEYRPEHIVMTCGAFAALVVTIRTITEPGDEIIFISPPWFFYEGMIADAGGVPVRVAVDAQTFALDLEAIEAAISERTRAIIVNSPQNPTGVIHDPDSLRGLAEILRAAGRRHGRPIYLISDEAYSRILFDGNAFHSPTSFYEESFLIYTYGKTLLTPGQRIGYIALSPGMQNAAAMRQGLELIMYYAGHLFPNALLQHALPDLERLCIDIAALQARRDRLAPALSEMGYAVTRPQGTFYMMARAPIDDDIRFVDMLSDEGILCLPGAVVEMPGWFRISLTASDAMVERSLPGFARARSRALSPG